jgi:hypothetical protein
MPQNFEVNRFIAGRPEPTADSMLPKGVNFNRAPTAGHSFLNLLLKNPGFQALPADFSRNHPGRFFVSCDLVIHLWSPKDI